ncbi:MAG: SAM-dependent methyltransferase [Paludibacteraceae bacterium]|nr:SAM-dependent methyltransferase [Paludibacteraceae bacterium]
MSPKLYLIPTTLGDSEINTVLPITNAEIIRKITHFIVEDIRSARRFLKKVDRTIEIDDLQFYVLNKRTTPEELSTFLQPLLSGNDMGVLSEAGCPAIADPGADVVRMAQEKNCIVVPLVGPSSIILSLMASGFNGQNFAFNGYLPIPDDERVSMIKKLEKKIYNEHQTQLFIETPFRNMKLVSDILQHCAPTTKLCIATDITLETEYIKTCTVAEWKKQMPELHKRLCIFLLYK